MRKKYLDEVMGVFSPDVKFDRSRYDANVKLIQILAQYLTDHPSERFGQALRNLEIVQESRLQDGGVCWFNEFNTEPREMVQRAKLALKRMGS